MLLKILTCYILIYITHRTRAECPKFHMLVEFERMTPPESDWDGFIVPMNISKMTWDYPMNTTEDYKTIKENNCILQIDYSNVAATCISTKILINKSKHIFVPTDVGNAITKHGVTKTISKDATTTESLTTFSTAIPIDSFTTVKNINESNTAFKSERYVKEDTTATSITPDSIVNRILEILTTSSEPSTLVKETTTLSTETSKTGDTTLEESTVGVSKNTVLPAGDTTLKDTTDVANATTKLGVTKTISKDATTTESLTTLSTTIPIGSYTTVKNVNESNESFKLERYVKEDTTATSLTLDSTVNTTLESLTTPTEPSTFVKETSTLGTEMSTTEDTAIEESTVGVSINTLLPAQETTLEDTTDETVTPTTEASTSITDEPTTVENKDLLISALKNSKDDEIGYVKAAAIFAGSVAGGAALIYLTTKAVTVIQSGTYRFPDPSSTPFLADTQV